MNRDDIKELSQPERLNSRLNICMQAYNKLIFDAEKLNVFTYRRFKEILSNEQLMSKLPADKLQFVKDAMVAFEPNKELLESSDHLKETINCRTEQYIANYERDATQFVREISGVLAEVWILVSMAEEVDEDIQQFMDIAFTGNEYGTFKTILDEIDVNEINDIKQVYLSDPKLALAILRDKVNEQVEIRNVFGKVEETIKVTEEEVVEEIKETKQKVEEEMNKNEETKEEFKGKDVKTDKDVKQDKYKKYLKYAAIAVAGLAVGYAGKKIYDNCTSDDIIIIDTDGIDNLDIMSSSCSVSLF